MQSQLQSNWVLCQNNYVFVVVVLMGPERTKTPYRLYSNYHLKVVPNIKGSAGTYIDLCFWHWLSWWDTVNQVVGSWMNHLTKPFPHPAT